jgi:mRNA-degrading endonuclease toxin of MazEF toxin-antitoxin module
LKFKRDAKAKENFVKVTKSIEKKLLNIDSEIANEFVEWFDKKATYLKQSLQKSSYLPQPDDLKRGDIVWVEFGINVGTELSDHQTKGHYAIVWAVDLGNVIVIPLSSRPAPGSCLTYDVGVIDGLVQEGVDYRSYLKLDAIRSISKRRIGRMPGKNGGKVTIDSKLLRTIQDIIKKNLVD